MAMLLPPVSEQEAVIGVDLNNSILQVFFLGIYTVVYFSTVYLYTSKKISHHWPVLTTISLSYLVYVIQASVIWFFIKLNVVDDGATRASIFTAAYYAAPRWITLFNDLCGFVMAALADGLLIWRCFNVWSRSRIAILVPSFLLFSEITIALSTIILASAVKLHPTPGQARTLNALIAASFFVTFSCTLCSTLLISVRLRAFCSSSSGLGGVGSLPCHSPTPLDSHSHSHPHSHTHAPRRTRGISSGGRSHGTTRTQTRVRHVMEILIQSAAVYSVMTIACAIPSIIPDSGDSGAGALLAARDYTFSLYLFTAGVAPTIMVARVIMPSGINAASTANNNGLTTRSLGFHFRSTTQGGLEGEEVEGEDEDEEDSTASDTGRNTAYTGDVESVIFAKAESLQRDEGEDEGEKEEKQREEEGVQTLRTSLVV